MSDDRRLTETGTAPTGEAWAWATEHGAPERASTAQLVSWLARRELPPHTLVWKPGWSEWMPAMQVAELAAAFPSVTRGSRRVAGAARDASWTPPPVPVAHYPRLRLLAKDVVGEPAGPSFTGIVPVQVGRRALRDLDHVQQDLVTSQVPVAKMLEAALAMKRQGAPAPPRRTLSPLALELGFPALLEPEPLAHPWRPKQRHARWLALGALIGGALALFAVRWPSQPDAPSALAASTSTGALKAATPEPSLARVVTGPCRSSRKAVSLDEWALRDMPPTLASISARVKVAEPSPGADVTVPAGWVAVGYAQSHENAVGLALSPASLELERLVARRMARRVVSVSPLVRDGVLAFHAEREGASVAFARTVVDVDPPLRVGMNREGVVAGRLEEQARRVWALPPGTVLSVPAITVHAGGLTLATLAGRGQGPVRVGVMSTRGEPLSALHQIGGSDARFGRPALASGGGTTALAVAARSRDGSRQSLWLSRADAGEPPLVLQPFEALPDEPMGGADLDAPAIAALPGGGFALLYRQGHGSKRRIRLQRLSATLDPLDAPVDVTTPERASRGASVGALYWVSDRLLAFHFLGRDGGGFSLWVSSLECELG